MNEQSLQIPLDPTAVDPAETLPQEEPLEAPKGRTRRKNANPATGSEQAGVEERPAPEPVLETPAENCDQSDPDLSPDPAADQPDPQELGRLREELNGLREEIRSARRTLIEQETELEEFRDLWPDVPLSTLPDAVLEDVRRGVPLAAAYALMERRRQKLEKIAAATNAANQARSSGSAEGDSSGFLSRAEVRAMSPEQVRKHYRQILLSMPKWH